MAKVLIYRVSIQKYRLSQFRISLVSLLPNRVVMVSTFFDNPSMSTDEFASTATSQYVTYLPGQGKVFGADTPGSLTPHAVDLMGEVYSNANLKVTDYAECHSVRHLIFQQKIKLMFFFDVSAGCTR